MPLAASVVTIRCAVLLAMPSRRPSSATPSSRSAARQSRRSSAVATDWTPPGARPPGPGGWARPLIRSLAFSAAPGPGYGPRDRSLLRPCRRTEPEALDSQPAGPGDVRTHQLPRLGVTAAPDGGRDRPVLPFPLGHVAPRVAIGRP